MGQQAGPREPTPRAAGTEPGGDVARTRGLGERTLAERVREELIASQLRAHLPPATRRAVDLGCGAGRQGLRLAAAGVDDVVLVDADPTACRLASLVVGLQDADVASRLRVVQADVTEALRRLPAHHDVVCAHGLLPHEPDAEWLSEACASLLRRGGVVSLTFRNAEAMAVRPALDRRWHDATARMLGVPAVHRSGRELASHSLDEVTVATRRAGLEVVAWYGVQAFTAHLHDHADDDEVQAALALEHHASDTDPYRRIANELHVLARA